MVRISNRIEDDRRKVLHWCSTPLNVIGIARSTRKAVHVKLEFQVARRVLALREVDIVQIACNKGVNASKLAPWEMIFEKR